MGISYIHTVKAWLLYVPAEATTTAPPSTPILLCCSSPTYIILVLVDIRACVRVSVGLQGEHYSQVSRGTGIILLVSIFRGWKAMTFRLDWVKVYSRLGLVGIITFDLCRFLTSTKLNIYIFICRRVGYWHSHSAFQLPKNNRIRLKLESTTHCLIYHKNTFRIRGSSYVQ